MLATSVACLKWHGDEKQKRDLRNHLVLFITKGVPASSRGSTRSSLDVTAVKA